MPTLARITVFPIKSLDGVELLESRLLPSGALEHDRRWAIVDQQGGFLNGKRTPRVHAIRATYDVASLTVSLRCGGQSAQFQLQRELAECAAWLSNVLGQRCRLTERADRGFPDDEEAPGPTLLSTASLETIADWFSLTSIDDARRRFRANLEIGDCAPFEEDRLTGDPDDPPRFRVGEIHLAGRRICQRCVVPSRDPESGEAIAAFAKSFAEHRRKSLLPDAPRRQFDHFYRVAVNTSVVSLQNGNVIRVGDQVQLTS